MTFDWNSELEFTTTLQLPEDSNTNDNRHLIRNIVMDWLNERFFPTKPNLTIFDKCILLFDKSCLFEISKEYLNYLASGKKHWVEYVHSISEDIYLNFGKNEIKENLKKYDIKPLDFVKRLINVSGFIEHIRHEKDEINDVSEYLNKELERLGSFCGFPYTSETNYIIFEKRYNIENLNEQERKQKIREILDSKEIPTEYEDPLMFDRCYERYPDDPFLTLDPTKLKKRKPVQVHPQKDFPEFANCFKLL